MTFFKISKQSKELWPLFEEFTEIKKEVGKYHNYTQDMRDRIEHIADNERFGKNEMIKLRDEYGTPKDYITSINKLRGKSILIFIFDYCF